MKPKIDLNSLRIEIREDDLASNYHIRTYCMFEYVLRDNERVFKVGTFDDVREWLKRKFQFDISYYLNCYSPATVYLKDDLTKHFNQYFGSIDNGKHLVGLI